MLGSLARKMRIFGFDTLYYREGRDADLEAIAKEEDRTILTSDESLFAQSKRRGIRAILVKGRTDRARLLSVLGQAGPGAASDLGRRGTSRCAVCNGRLEVLGKDKAATKKIPARVLARHRLFYRCESCSRLYWRGRHWERLRRLVWSVKTKAIT